MLTRRNLPAKMKSLEIAGATAPYTSIITMALFLSEMLDRMLISLFRRSVGLECSKSPDLGHPDIGQRLVVVGSDLVSQAISSLE
ncbi:uncharacterized protein G2W53_026580 [Senna tora]|uniref:Uncharacterized protein n=1 Tax=Senna tora TaxID=362788 RepID=A0A834THP8_9FABA|nr:uncharacterized protein G2W53_026580 [Senna tora]